VERNGYGRLWPVGFGRGVLVYLSTLYVFRLMKEASALCWYDLAPRLRITNTLHPSLKPNNPTNKSNSVKHWKDCVSVIVLDDGEIEYRNWSQAFRLSTPNPLPASCSTVLGFWAPGH